ncbi:minor capsid protein [Anaerotignum sp. MB30-C6]|uniref:minor capsid protein n=1 Tax=Anaerotignum sp. MB30-C6 TaxID=3070814 RepID=UPI0027DC8390|nr:minor capsid protein [Anaerotignum sp. MB30-C6]WMI81843.1 minor capsid protein [Anaerotignum sp. MB30-C6]
MNYRVDLLSARELSQRKGLGEGGVIQKYIDSEVIKHCAPYAPFETGQMQKSATLGTVIGSGEIVYNSPYAKFLYYGKVMVSPSTGSPWAKKGERKNLTQKPLQYNGAPKRGAYWFERMKVDHGDAILKEVERLGK